MTKHMTTKGLIGQNSKVNREYRQTARTKSETQNAGALIYLQKGKENFFIVFTERENPADWCEQRGPLSGTHITMKQNKYFSLVSFKLKNSSTVS